MKVFFDTNVYVAEAILGGAAERMLEATQRASWRIFCTRTVIEEARRVLVESLGFSHRLGSLAQARILRRATFVEPMASRHTVPLDLDDSPILIAALRAGADYLVTNDSHLLALDPFQGLRIVSMHAYYKLLVNEGILRDE